MMRTLLAAALLLAPAAGASCQSAGGALLIPPPQGAAAAPPAALVYAPHTAVPNCYYKNASLAVQQRLNGTLSLYVAVLACSGASCGASDFAAALAQLRQAAGGLPRGMTFAGGHGDGAAAADAWVRGNGSGAAGGAVLCGGALPAGVMTTYPVPVAVLAAELDFASGRLTKQAAAYREAVAWAAGSRTRMAAEKAVLALPGLDLSDFSRGFHVQGDLPSEAASDAAANAAVAAALGDWLLLRAGAAGAAKAVGARIATTDSLLAPFISLWGTEDGGSWCASAQSTLAQTPTADGSPAVRKEQLQVAAHPTDTSKHFEDGHVKYSVNGSAVAVDVYSYNWPFDGATAEVGAMIVGCKLASRQRVRQQLGMSTPTDPSDTCMALNQGALDLATKTLPAATTQRWKKQGKPMLFGPDFTVTMDIGPLWLKKDPKYDETPESLTLSVPTLNTTIKSMLFPGVHYCKLLSPAHAAEWVMVDSLKALRFPSSAPAL
eukprot:TRINITY_DN55499_c0_g1_i1.p2 TRINITY_DN55499_c0_g1~~TRINITY_DN55499_c0_g1_i1.p2  ORF type:complete len:512 (+),score=193.15 TRINITY_DN55499_c0_g1_i1:66-1538(+)